MCNKTLLILFLAVLLKQDILVMLLFLYLALNTLEFLPFKKTKLCAESETLFRCIVFTSIVSYLIRYLLRLISYDHILE